MEDKILLAHGSGGKLSHELIATVFRPAFSNPALDAMDDAAVLAMSAAQVPGTEDWRLETGDYRLAFTTDSYVVKPLFFPGGDIGRLAVSGTVNDLAVMGATPLWLAAAFVIEEGLPLATLQRVVASMRATAAEAGVTIVTGDTKVVEKGGADGLFVNTAGVGVVPAGVDISGAKARPGDVVIVSGPIGDHGIAVISQREGLAFQTTIESDAAPLNGLVAAIVKSQESNVNHIHALRDPTRGGLATTLNEIARQSGVAIRLEETAIPVRDGVRAACELLGYDPLYVANEGKLVAMVAPEAAEAVLAAMRRHPLGTEAAVIGTVAAEPAGRVLLRTRIGGTRLVDMLTGEMLPRIC
jgi:hydrogenase expression/formation protein HypE